MNRTPYPSDLSELQWDNLEHLFPPPKTGGRPREYDNRDLVNAILYVTRSGCSWRMLPHDFPPWQSVYGYFRRWRLSGLWKDNSDRVSFYLSPISQHIHDHSHQHPFGLHSSCLFCSVYEE